jgi:hypothetical protein
VLTFQPALDPFHAVFRSFRLLTALEECSPIEWDKYRVLDFYLAFPFRAADFKFPKGQTAFRKVAKAMEWMRPYGGLPDDQDLVVRMEPVQSAAVQTLASLGYLDQDALKGGAVDWGVRPLPDLLKARIQEVNGEQADLMVMLSSLCLSVPLLGQDGIKRRSGLLEYRNDAI